jgi:putative transposase
MPRPRKPASPFRYFNSSPEVIRLVVMMYVRFPLSLRNVEDLLFERGIDVCHETVRLWWNRFGPIFSGEVRRQRVSQMRGFRHWRWHLDEMYVKLNGEMAYLWRAVDHEGEILESYITKTRDKEAALTFMKKALKQTASCPGPQLALMFISAALHSRLLALRRTAWNPVLGSVSDARVSSLGASAHAFAV